MIYAVVLENHLETWTPQLRMNELNHVNLPVGNCKLDKKDKASKLKEVNKRENKICQSGRCRR